MDRCFRISLEFSINMGGYLMLIRIIVICYCCLGGSCGGVKMNGKYKLYASSSFFFSLTHCFPTYKDDISSFGSVVLLSEISSIPGFTCSS